MVSATEREHFGQTKWLQYEVLANTLGLANKVVMGILLNNHQSEVLPNASGLANKENRDSIKKVIKMRLHSLSNLYVSPNAVLSVRKLMSQ